MTTTLTNPIATIREHLTADASTLSDDLIARAAWSTLTEPGDIIAGTFVAQHGPVTALSLLLVGEFASTGDLATLTGQAISRYSPTVIADTINRAARLGVTILTPQHPAWPTRIDDLGTATPFLLWCLGDPTVLATATVCVTGARAATAYGEHIAAELAADLTGNGHGVINGGAYGIDGASLRSVMADGGRPIAVLAGGVDRLYPAGHTELLTRVAHTGVVVSEVPIGTAPTRHRFVQRNRIIAALAEHTIIVEAGQRSGALGTATHAHTLGRNVFAVPGPLTWHSSTGCHHLIREGIAQLLTSADDLTTAAHVVGEITS